MSKRMLKVDSSASKQQALFDMEISEGCLDISLGLKQLLSQLLRGYDRYLVAAQISKMTLKEVSKETLDKILSSDPAYQPSTLVVLAVCKITGSFEPYQYQLSYIDADVLLPCDRDLVELARLTEQRREIDQRLQQIQAKRGLR